MDKAALVTIDLAKGTEWLKALDDSDLGISVATWVYLPEYEDWRFVLSSRRSMQFDFPKPMVWSTMRSTELAFRSKERLRYLSWP